VTSDSGASPVTTYIDLRGRGAAGLTHATLASVLPRAALDVDRAVDLIRPVTEDVRVRGGVAVRQYTNRFDGVDLERTRVPQDVIDNALKRWTPR
jgi:histidinol dehydrogenase